MVVYVENHAAAERLQILYNLVLTKLFYMLC